MSYKRLLLYKISHEFMFRCYVRTRFCLLNCEPESMTADNYQLTSATSRMSDSNTFLNALPQEATCVKIHQREIYM